jgi:hypothetical protein
MIEQKIAEIIGKYFKKRCNKTRCVDAGYDCTCEKCKIITNDIPKAILALIAEEQKPLVEALEKIRDDFVPDKGQQELALEEIRECADTALRGVGR